VTVSSDLAGLSTDGTLQRFAMSVAASAAAAKIGVSDHDALVAANDPDTIHSRRTLGDGRAVHARGDVLTIVDLVDDLVLDVRQVVFICASTAVCAP
jgi:hypothetical protein